MADDLTELLNRFAYDIERILKNALGKLSHDLDSGDERTQELAANEIDEILDWLLPPPKPLSKEAKLQKVKEIFGNRTLSEREKADLAKKILCSTGKPKGRPRTETAQHAIKAYSLHLSTPMSWREIALKVVGCKHERPNPERSCESCGDAIRDAVGRLDEFLQHKGYRPNVPRRIDLDKMSASEIERTIPEF
jgi:hypothetical protein